MKITIITVGKKHSSEFLDAINQYEKRIRGSQILDWKIINPISVKNDGNIPQVLKLEGEQILNSLQSGDFVVALDEHGKEKSTIEFSEIIEKSRVEAYKRLVFIIGGSYGLSEDVKRKATLLLSLSKMTFPHQLIRLVLIEQIYRAISILSGGKYHHE